MLFGVIVILLFKKETILLSGDSTFSRENIKPIAILEEQSVIANNKVLTVAASEGNPAMITFSNDGQVLVSCYTCIYILNVFSLKI